MEQPADRGELSALIEAGAETGEEMRVIGCCHSPNEGPQTPGLAISLRLMNKILGVDRERGEVRVEAGIELDELNALLWREGLALANLGDIGDQALGGAVATGTHGTGAALGNISASVRAALLTLADGTEIEVSERHDPEALRAARVSIGALGVLTEVTLAVVPAFALCGRDRPLPIAEVLDGLEGMLGEHDHFQFYKFPYADTAVVRVADRIDGPPRPPGRLRSRAEHAFHWSFEPICRLGRVFPVLIPSLNRVVARSAGTPQRVDRSYHLLNRLQLVRFTEMEYAIPRESATAAIQAIDAATERGGFAAPFPLQVRFGTADDALLSPAAGRDTCYVAAHMYRGMEWQPYFQAVERILVELGGRPHWGKRHGRTADQLRGSYPDWSTFAAVRRRLDPGGRFANRYVRRVLGDTVAVEAGNA